MSTMLFVSKTRTLTKSAILVVFLLLVTGTEDSTYLCNYMIIITILEYCVKQKLL